MALFGRRPGDDLLARVDIPAFYGDPVAQQVGAAAAAGDLAAVRRAVETADLDRLAVLVRAVGVHLDPDLAWHAVERTPDDPLAWQLHASSLAGAARSARGAGMASTVAHRAVVDFVEGMAGARRSLGRVLEVRPGDPLTLSEAVFTSYAGPRENLLADVRALRDTGVPATDGLRTAVNLLGAKWYGSVEEAMEVAWWASDHAPAGHDVHAVLAFAVYEQFLYLRDHRGRPGDAQAWVSGEAARTAVAAALHRGYRDPAHRPTPLTPRLRNDLAYACGLVGDRLGAAEQFAALRGVATRYPWAHPKGGPAQGFAQAWRRAVDG